MTQSTDDETVTALEAFEARLVDAAAALDAVVEAAPCLPERQWPGVPEVQRMAERLRDSARMTGETRQQIRNLAPLYVVKP